MVSSALYRYFASRDDLLTALIIDAYNALGRSRRAGRGGHRPGRPAWVVTPRSSHAVRDWALAHPHEYALIYGSPVPGYAAPQDTVGPASRVITVLITILIDGVGAGIVRPVPGDWLNPTAAAELARFCANYGIDMSPSILARGMIAWTELFGAVSFEVFGRLNGMIADRGAWFDHQVLAMARLVGLRP